MLVCTAALVCLFSLSTAQHQNRPHHNRQNRTTTTTTIEPPTEPFAADDAAAEEPAAPSESEHHTVSHNNAINNQTAFQPAAGGPPAAPFAPSSHIGQPGSRSKGDSKFSHGQNQGEQNPAEPQQPAFGPQQIQGLPPVATKCIDGHQRCPFWASAPVGHCQKNAEWMARNCPASCSTCTPKYIDFENCVDIHPNCTDMAPTECAKNPLFMIWQCPRICQFCNANGANAYPSELQIQA